MPTPFTHLRITQDLMTDPLVPQAIRNFMAEYRPATLLGGVIADQRPAGGKRADTHFYEYTQPMPDNPWREMFRQHPSLCQAKSEAHQAFLLSYVAHLAADEYWSRHMLKPHFADSDWGEGIRHRFFLLHLLLITMDERDELSMTQQIATEMQESVPDAWLPFLTDTEICEWRDFIAQQIAEKDSQTLVVFGKRVSKSPQELRTLLDDPDYMQSQIWDNIAHQILEDVESNLYTFAREQLIVYWNEQQKRPETEA